MATPKLRFKEFDGNWKSDKVGKFLIEYKQKVPSSTDIEIYSSSRNGLKPQKEYFDNRELQNFGEYGVVPPNYLTYRHMSDDTTFKFNINLIGKKIAVSKEYPVFTTNEFMDSSFLLFKLNESNDFKKFAIEQKKGGTRTRLYFKALCTWETLLPTKEEQTKIASFLSAVDEKINQLTQKHQLLSQYKQGMMQKLFSQQIRFKANDGSEFEEWEEKQLGDVCHFINGRAYKQTEWEKEGTPVIRLQNLTGSGKEYYYSTLNLPDHQYCYNNDLLYMWSATFGPIFWQGEKAIFHYHIWKVEVKPQQLDKQYMYYLLDEMTEKMKSSLNGSTMLHVTKQGMESTKKNLPSIEEQTKIANFLSAIDQKINVVSGQIEQAKLWKKGLLQQMFV